MPCSWGPQRRCCCRGWDRLRVEADSEREQAEAVEGDARIQRADELEAEHGARRDPGRERCEPPPALPEPGVCRGQTGSDEPDGRKQPADPEDRTHDRRACVVDALVADQDRCQLADEEERGAGRRQEETDVGATARAGETAACEAEHRDEDEHVQERPQDRHGDERAAREGVAPHLVRDAGRRLHDRLDDQTADRGRRCADDAGDCGPAERVDVRLCHVSLASGVVVDLLAATLRVAAWRVVGGSAGPGPALVLVPAECQRGWPCAGGAETIAGCETGG